MLLPCDVDETECQVNFMRQAGKFAKSGQFQWIKLGYQTWSQVNILKLDKQPEPHEGCSRCFTRTKQNIENELFQCRKEDRD